MSKHARWLGFVALACVGCTQPVADSAIEQSQHAIVNGSAEAGLPGVGALVFLHPGGLLEAQYCTGTLIAPRWVLTAAHCLTPQDELLVPSPQTVVFYLGPNATPVNGQFPAGGNVYAVKELYPHANYDPTTGDMDLGLVLLEEAIPNVTPLPLATSQPQASDSLRAVGFGAADSGGEGSGVKRSATLEIGEVYWGAFTAFAPDSGLCFGDSGGPGLRQVMGVWKVAGVASSVVPDGTGEPCANSQAIYVRVDAAADWIADTIATFTPVDLPDVVDQGSEADTFPEDHSQPDQHGSDSVHADSGPLPEDWFEQDLAADVGDAAAPPDQMVPDAPTTADAGADSAERDVALDTAANTDTSSLGDAVPVPTSGGDSGGCSTSAPHASIPWLLLAAFAALLGLRRLR